MRKIVCCSIFAGAVLGFCSASSPAQQPLQTLHHHVRHAVSNGQASPLGRLDRAQHLQFSIVLQPRNQEELSSLLSRIYDPLSPDYHKFLSVSQFADQFAPTAEDYQSVIDYARAQGFKVKGKSANRLLVSLEGTVAQVEAAFHVRMGAYQHPTEARTFFSPDREPSLALGVPVMHIAGLNNYSLPRPAAVRRDATTNAVSDVTGSGPGGTYRGSDMRAAYYGGTALTGVGQTVGLLEFGGYNLSDVNLTFSNTHQSYSVPINNVLLDGLTGASGSEDAEQVLDIVQAIGMAPGLSQVRVYIGAWDADILNAIATEDLAQEVSISWSWTPDDPQTDDVFFQEMAAQGQSVFVASGDYGAYDSAVSPFFYPAEDDYVITVGGTHLNTSSAGGPWLSETAWKDSGGGISPDQLSIPSWQSGVTNSSNHGSPIYRNVPDIAMEADFDNYACNLGSCSGGWGGTSFAAPRWAAYVALANQQAAEAGETQLGFLNPVIYPLAEGANYASNFHDIISGNNDSANQPIWYNAVAGYDLITGWGSPKGQNLINTLAPLTGAGFMLTAAPTSLFIAEGASGSATVSIFGSNGFSGGVNLSVLGLPAGVTPTWSANPASTQSTLTLSVSSGTVPGSYPLTVTGTWGGLTRSTTITLTVPAPFFILSTIPNNYSLYLGTSASGYLDLTGANGFSGAVTLSVSGLPSGVTLSFGSNPPSSASTSMTVVATNSATPGTSTVTITGISGSITTSTTVTVTVLPAPPPSFFTPISVNFGSSNIGSASSVQTFTYTFSSAVALGSVAVLTDGATGLDFANAGTGTCAANTQYAAGQSCTVDVIFTPRLAGTRNGAVVLTASTGNVIATGYLQGTGIGPQINFLPGTQSTFLFVGGYTAQLAVDGSESVYITDFQHNRVLKETLISGAYVQSIVGSGFNGPLGVVVDGSGDVFIADTYNNRVVEETPSAGGYLQSQIGTGFNLPMRLAVDGSGNLYIAEYGNNRVLEESPSSNGYTQSVVASAGLNGPSGVAVDGSGDVFIADVFNNRVLKETPSGSSYNESTVSSSALNNPNGVAVDGFGNIYITDSGNNRVLKETPAAGGYVENTVANGLSLPSDVAVDGLGNVYVSDTTAESVLKLDYADLPSLSFASTFVGATSSDSPRTITLENIGNANLNFPAPSSGSNPSIGTDFTLNGSAPNACPVVTNGSPAAATLSAGMTCALSVSFAPTVGGTLNESLTLTDNNLNAASPAYVTQSISLSGVGKSTITPTITWSGPAAITYGTPLSATQLNATANVPGTFSYSPAIGAILSAGTHTLTVTFTPTDTTDYSTATATVMLTVNQATPVLTWGTPSPITYGTPLGSAQLNASSTVAGTFSYSPAAGAVLTAGAQTLTVTFTPTDTTDYRAATATVTLTVNKATPIVTWGMPVPITYGTPLGSAQLNASATVAGTFNYSPAAGTVLTVGTQTLTVTFTPTDSTDYTTATAAVTLTVNPVPTPSFFAPSSANLGSSNIGSVSSAQAFTYTFTSGFTVGSTAVLTQGSTGLDFADAGTGTCAANTYYAAGQSCTVNVLFTPRFAGTRYGAVVLHDSIGDVVAIAYLQGTGVGPQITFQPSTQNTVTTFTSGDPYPGGVASDGIGNVYIVSYTNNCGSAQLVKETPLAGSYTGSVIPTTPMSCPGGVAVDGAGNIYVADSGHFRVIKETPIAGSYVESTVATFPVASASAPVGVAVDGSGNVYIPLGSAAGIVYKETLTTSGYVQSTVVSGLPSDAGIAVDGSGSVYIAINETNGWVVKATPTVNGYSQSTIPVSGAGVPSAVALDGSGDVYVTFINSNNGLGQVFKETVTANGYSQSTVPTGGLNQPDGIAVDGAGNVYVADYGNLRVVEENLALPPSLSFAATGLGSTSTDSPQAVTVTNTGNSNLVFSALSYPADFPARTGANGVCTSSTPVTAGNSCTLSINFSPVSSLNGASSAVLNEAVTMTTNAAPQTQSIVVSGTETPAPTAGTTTVASSVTATYSSSAQNVTLMAHVTSAAGTVNAGAVTFTVLSGAATIGTPTTSSTVANGAASVSYILPAGTAAGTYTIQAAYSGSGQTFSGSNGTGSLIIGQITPTITWPTPSAITYGTALSSTQLKATANVPGMFSYSPAAGTVLPAGKQTLNVTFTPTDSTDYATATKSVVLTVNLSTPKISPAGGSYTSAQTVTITDSPGAAIYYTTDGSTPTTGSILYQSSVSVSQSMTIKAIAVESGLANSTAVTATYSLKVPTPVIGPPASGAYTVVKSVPLSDSNSSAVIWYTTDGTTPVPGQGTAVQYVSGSPVQITQTTVLKAVAAVTGWTTSSAASATYTLTVPVPVIGPPSTNTYTAVQSVPISDSNSSAVIWYTTDGSTPVPGQGTAVQYVSGSPVSITQTTVLKATAAISGWTTSSAASATYTLKVPTPTIGPPASGAYTASKAVPISDSNSSAIIWYTTDGSTPVPGQGTAVQYSGTPVQITQTTVLKAIAAVSGWTTSSAASATYTLKVPTPVIGPPGSGTFSVAQLVPISDSNSSAVIWYTTDGTTPVPGQGTALQYTGTPVQIAQTAVLKAVAAISGWTASSTASATYTIHN